MEHILKVSQLSISLKDKGKGGVLVDDITFNVKKGSILGIVGESGSGKTLFTMAIMQLLSPGIFRVGGKVLLLKNNKYVDLTSLNEDDISSLRGNDIAMIFQEPLSSVNPNKRCGTQLEESILTHHQIKISEAKAKVIKLLHEVGLEETERIMDSFPHQLSGGQLQRIMIAMAISNNPVLLLADEPTTSLDVTTQKEILNLLKSLTYKMGMTTIMISHDPAVIGEIADEILVMKNGKVIESGNLQKLIKSPEQEYTRTLLDVSLRSDSDKIFHSHQNLNDAEILLNIRHLSKYFEVRKSFLSRNSIFINALNDVSVQVRRGEIHGIVGESGSGKSTLVKCITGLQYPDRGEISYKSKPLYKNGAYALDRKLIQMVFQDPYSSLNPRMQVGKAILEALPGRQQNKKARVIELLQEVGLEKTYFDRYPHQLSGGQRQRICIARALASKPELLICDEAVSALDKNVQNKIINLLKQLKNTRQLTIIFISHDLSVVHKLCEYITVMYKGRVEESGQKESIFQSPSTNYTKKLIASIPAIP